MSNILKHIGRFFTWWSQGLYKGLPDSLHKWINIEPARLILAVDMNSNVKAIWQKDGKKQERDEFQLSQSSSLDITQFVPKRFRKKKYCVDLRLPKGKVLHLKKRFPENIKDNLTQAIRYQIDRLTPFSTNDVYFDAVVSEHNKKANNIVADIYVTSRSLVEKQKAEFKAHGIEQIDIVSVEHEQHQLNLTTDGVTDTNLKPKVSRIPLYFMLASLVVALIVPVAYKERRIDQLDTAISNLKKNSAGKLSIREKLFEAEEALAFLKEKRATSPMALDVVDTLAKDIPKDTWLERLELSGSTLEIRGESEKALSLIDLLEESPSFSKVRFNSPVALNKKNKRDKFHIQATVEVPHG